MIPRQLFVHAHAHALALALLLCAACPGLRADDGATAERIPVVLIGGQNSDDWRRSNAFLMELLSHQAGLQVTEDNAPEHGSPEAWAAWKIDFSRYRCVILNYNGEMWPESLRSSLEHYLDAGGNLIVLHAATNSFSGWEAFEHAVGLLYRPAAFGESVAFSSAGALVSEPAGQGRAVGHGDQYDWLVTEREASPITAGMPPQWRHRRDELYHALRGSAAHLHILLSAFSDPAHSGSGNDEPIMWWSQVGKGKVLTDLMGQVGETASLSCVGYQTTLLRSIEWLATGQCTTAIPQDFPTAERASQFYPGGLVKSHGFPKTPEESLKDFTLPPGYHIELVAQDPMIINPVAFAWDGDGRMFVCEMRTYMMDADGSHEADPKSRVSMLVDTTGDGIYDKATAYVDNLVLPRMVLPMDDRVVIAETYTGKFVSYKDTNGDGVADEHVLVYDGGETGANLEHQDSALLWGTDNCVYSAQVANRRFRVGADLKWTADPIFGNSSQWGLGMDDMGRLFSATAGGENPGYGFQQHPQYGAMSLGGEQGPEFGDIYPRMQAVDVQGDLGRVQPIRGTLNHFTACAGQSIFRGDRLPSDFYGDYLLPEPVGRMIRRAKVEVIDGKRVLVNAYKHDEFITSTDPAFRPVWTATGPDGCLYIGDLHHGIVQEGNWTRPGSYLRGIIDRDGIAAYIGHGRIYRVTHDGFKPGPKPAMLEKTPAELVQYLSHPNGWWRDMAQQLIVLRHDLSVVPALVALATHGDVAIGRVHALWTLDGLGASDRTLLIAAFADPDARVRVTAVRICERFLSRADGDLVAHLKALTNDPDVDVVVQVADSLRYCRVPAATEILDGLISSHTEIVAASAQQSEHFGTDHPAAFDALIDPVEVAMMKKGHDHFTQVCFACHGLNGTGVVTSDGMRMGPPLAGSARVLGNKEAMIRIVLHGLSGEIDGKTYSGLMLPMLANDDQTLAEVITYIRKSFGNRADLVSKEDVARVRAATSAHSAPFTLAELACYAPVPRTLMKDWVFSASSNSGKAGNVADGDMRTRWDTGAGQTPGQWFQIDMGKPMLVTQLTLNCTGSDGDFPRGWEVRTSDDGQTWSEPVAKGPGRNPVIQIVLPSAPVARYLRITQTGSVSGLYWSIHELTVYGMEKH